MAAENVRRTDRTRPAATESPAGRGVLMLGTEATVPDIQQADLEVVWKMSGAVQPADSCISPADHALTDGVVSPKAHQDIACAHEPQTRWPRKELPPGTDLRLSRDLLLGFTREPDLGYDDAWCSRWAGLKLITIETCLVNSDSWPYVPQLKQYRAVPTKNRDRVAEAFGKSMGSALNEVGKPAVVCVEKPYLDGFICGFGQTIGVPFVLLAVSGGDAPLTLDLQERIMALQAAGLRACFANNLHQPRNRCVFRPMPIGITAEALLYQIRNSALPWKERDRRLLVPPMRNCNRLRAQYFEVLCRVEYSHLVRIASERVDQISFMKLLSEHQSVLSPPGRGYDCGRTWQALAVGSVPLVVEDAMFDQRIHVDVGTEYIPRPEQLTPGILEQLLSSFTDPARYFAHLQVRSWMELWKSHLT